MKTVSAISVLSRQGLAQGMDRITHGNDIKPVRIGNPPGNRQNRLMHYTTVASVSGKCIMCGIG